jgi:aspartate/methionine/tyrosine aminotransferase
MIMEVESPEQIGYDRVRYNLAESSMGDRVLGELGLDLSSVTLCYGDHRGHPGLRELIASDGGSLTADDVLLCAGAAGALFTAATALLGPGDHAVVAHPNYASNFETPRAIGAKIDFLRLSFDEGWRVDLDHLAALIRPETKLVSLTTPHNPTGTEIPPADLERIIALVEASNAYLLLDETYRELAPDVRAPWAALSPRVLSVSSLSKTYGMPGIRLGWLICQDAALMEQLLAGKEQILLGGSVVDEEIAHQTMVQRDELLAAARAHASRAFAIVRDWMATEALLEWVEPTAGVVCFPRMVADSGVDPVAFHRRLFADHGTLLGPGHWFEQDPRHFRLGFGYPTHADLEAGLATISAVLRAAD